ncbi:unnamed protein product [Urochloa humidicola]
MATRCRSGGSDEAATSPARLKRKPSAEPDDEPAAARRVRSKSPPAACALHQPPPPPPEAGEEGVLLLPLSPPVDAAVSDDDDDAAAAEFARVFPDIPPGSAASLWEGFVRNAKACIKHYNTKCQADFSYKHAPEYGILFLREPDGSHYYHLNFHAKDKRGHSQIFFGEVRVCVAPEEEDVTCCCPVSPSDAGGKRLETFAESTKYKFPAWGTAGMDTECCYGCSSVVKHPKGPSYVAGHVADPRQYFVPHK